MLFRDTFLENIQEAAPGDSFHRTPLEIHPHELQQEFVMMLVSLTAGLAAWCLWIGMRQSDSRLLALISIMSFFIGVAWLVVAQASCGKFIHGASRGQLSHRTGYRYLLAGLVATPAVAIPFLIK